MSGNNGKLPASDYCRARGNQSKSLSTVLRQHSRQLGGAAEHLIHSLYVSFLSDTCIKSIVHVVFLPLWILLLNFAPFALCRV